MIYSGVKGHTLGVNYHFWGINEHFGGSSVHCGQILQKILARGRAPLEPPPLSGNARILGAYEPQTHPL